MKFEQSIVILLKIYINHFAKEWRKGELCIHLYQKFLKNQSTESDFDKDLDTSLIKSE